MKWKALVVFTAVVGMLALVGTGRAADKKLTSLAESKINRKAA